mgnify:CR=1 FL=1
MREHEIVGSEDAARSMRDHAVRLRHTGTLDAPHMATLTNSYEALVLTALSQTGVRQWS